MLKYRRSGCFTRRIRESKKMNCKVCNHIVSERDMVCPHCHTTISRKEFIDIVGQKKEMSILEQYEANVRLQLQEAQYYQQQNQYQVWNQNQGNVQDNMQAYIQGYVQENQPGDACIEGTGENEGVKHHRNKKVTVYIAGGVTLLIIIIASLWFLFRPSNDLNKAITRTLSTDSFQFRIEQANLLDEQTMVTEGSFLWDLENSNLMYDFDVFLRDDGSKESVYLNSQALYDRFAVTYNTETDTVESKNNAAFQVSLLCNLLKEYEEPIKGIVNFEFDKLPELANVINSYYNQLGGIPYSDYLYPFTSLDEDVFIETMEEYQKKLSDKSYLEERFDFKIEEKWGETKYYFTLTASVLEEEWSQFRNPARSYDPLLDSLHNISDCEVMIVVKGGYVKQIQIENAMERYTITLDKFNKAKISGKKLERILE